MRRGFGLIELLVVISITALLLGITIPALLGARKRSEQAQCGMHIKQLMAGALTYAAESRQTMMFSNSKTVETETDPKKPKWTGAGWLYDWNQLKDESRNRSQFKGSDIRRGVMWYYINETREPFFCPSSKQSEEDDSGDAEVMSNYMMTSAVTGLKKKVLPFRIDRFEAKHVAFWEPKEETGNFNDGNIEPINGYTTRHVEGLNVVCFDGHVEFWTNLTFEKEAYPPDGITPANKDTYRPPYATRLWCDPRDPVKGWAP